MKPQILRDLRFLFSLVVAAVSPLLFSRVACGPTGVSGAGGPVCGAGLLCGARPLCVPVGGGPPARSPHASLRLGVVDLEARPGPAATHRHRGQALRRPPASSTPVGPGHCSAALRVVSKPGQALPPPTGTAADPSGALHTGGAWCADVWLGASSRSPARPCRRPPAPQPGPPVPSNPSNRSALGRESPKTQTTSVKMGEFGVFWARWSVFWAHGGYE